MSSGFKIGNLWFGMSVDTKPLTTGIRTSEKQLTTSMDKVERQSAGLGAAFTRLADGLGKIGLAGLGLQTLAGSAQKLGESIGVGLVSELEQTRAQFIAFTKDAALTDKIMADLRKEANATPFAFRELATATASLIPASRQANVRLEDLVTTAEILAASNPAEGLEGAAFALREAMSGDFASIIERFNLPRQMLQFKQLAKEGVPPLKAVQRAMTAMGYDASLVSNMANTAAGRWSTFMDTIDTLKTTLATPVFDVLSSSLVTLQGILDANQETLQAWATVAGQNLATAVGTGINAVLTFIGALRGDWAGQTSADIDEFTKTIGRIGLFINQHVLPSIQALAAIAQKAFSGDIAGAVGDLVRRMTGERASFAAQLLEWGQALVAWIKPFIPPLLAELGKLADEAFTWVQGQLPGWMKQLEAWGTALVEFVKPFIPPLLDALGKLMAEMLGWVGAQAQPLLQRFVNEWVPAALGWVLEAAQQVVPELLKLSGRILDWIGAEGPGIARRFVTEWLPAALKWTADLLVDVIPKLDQLLLTITEWVVKEGVPKAVTAFLAIGDAIIDGIAQGIKDGAIWLGQQLKTALDDLVKQGIAAIQGHSPSRVFAEAVGQPIAQGVAAGILAESDTVQRALAGLLAAPPMRLPALPDAGGGRLPSLAGMGRVTGSMSAPITMSISVRDDADMARLEAMVRGLPARLNEEWGQSWDTIVRSGYRRAP
jgi:hypothetical protein